VQPVHVDRAWLQDIPCKVMVQISNDDARLILALLERAPTFYRIHAVKSSDMDDARLMAKMAKRLKQKVNRAAAESQPQIKKQQ